MTTATATQQRRPPSRASAHSAIGRGDPPESMWAGREVTIEEVAMACGDDRDYFSYDMRLQAAKEAKSRYTVARKNRRNMASKFKFGQIMLIGDMGASKSTLAAWDAYRYYQRGHPFFHNGGFLFGRMVEGAGIYEIVDQVPRNSVIAVDEAHTGLESGMAGSTGVRAFTILCAGLRKKNCRLLMMSAMAVMVTRRIREMCSEVWRPMKPNIELPDYGYQTTPPPHNDPSKFVFCWDVWRDFPFRGIDITSSKRGAKGGFGPPEDTYIAMGDSVRNAFMMTDSFQPVATAVAQQFANKEAMSRQREAGQQGLTDDHKRIIGYLWKRGGEADPPLYMKVDTIALSNNMTASRAGRIMRGLFGDVDNAQHGAKGYHMPTVMMAVDDKFDISGGA